MGKLQASQILALEKLVADSMPYSVRPEQFVNCLGRAYPDWVSVRDIQLFYGALSNRDPITSFVEFINVYRIVRDRLAKVGIYVVRTNGTPSGKYRLQGNAMK